MLFCWESKLWAEAFELDDAMQEVQHQLHGFQTGQCTPCGRFERTMFKEVYSPATDVAGTCLRMFFRHMLQ